jgi:alkanesulfonate monooxygenase SsuD/methylene tetrahydromethanopterin reductase-like flavin-dependent oxidoreductase (luciferase family)
MRFGLALPHYGFSFPDGDLGFRRVAEVALRAEALGFDSVWVSDHFFYSFSRYGADGTPIAALEPMTSLAGLAAVTERVRLGSLVLCSAFRHPSVLAKQAATVQAISRGRLELGVGAGWFEEEFARFGYRFGSPDERFRAMERTLAVLASLRAGGPVTLDADGATLRDASLLPPLDAPIWVGGKGGPRLLRLAARYADGWNVVWRISPEAFAERAAAARRAWQAASRDPASLRLSVGLYALVAEDAAGVAALFEEGRRVMPGGALDAESLASWSADTLTGTPERVAERIGAFEELGVEELIVSPWVLPFALPRPELLETFAEGVIAPLRAG